MTAVDERPRGLKHYVENRLTLVLPVVVSLAVYVVTACRTVGPGDSAELTVVLSSWGVAHAPGYPLLTLIGNLLSLLPWPGEPAFALNLLSAIASACACGFVASAVDHLTRNRSAAMIAGLALASSRVFWEYSLVVEVFPLNNLAASLLLYGMARFLRALRENRIDRKSLYLSAAVMSTSITHHLTLVLVAIPVLLVYLAAIPRIRRLGSNEPVIAGLVFRCLGVGLIGLLPLIYLPIAAMSDDTLVWGDPGSVGGLYRLLSRGDYGESVLVPAEIVAQKVMLHGPEISPVGMKNFRLFWTELPRNFGWVFPVLCLGGLAYALIRQRLLALFMLAFLVMLWIFFRGVNSPILPLFRGITERFSILPHVVLALTAGCGVSWLLEFLARFHERASTLASLVLFALTAGTMFPMNWDDVDMSDNVFTREFGADIMEGVPQGAIVFGIGDLFHNSFHYRQRCLGHRPDLTYVDLSLASHPWYVDQLRRRGRIRVPDGIKAYKGGDQRAGIVHWFDLNLRHASNPEGRHIVVTRLRDNTANERYRLHEMGFWSTVARAVDEIPLEHRANTLARMAPNWHAELMLGDFGDRSWEKSELQVYPRSQGLAIAVRDLALDLKEGQASLKEREAIELAVGTASRRLGGEASLAAFRAIAYSHLVENTPESQRAGVSIHALRAKSLRLAERALELAPEDPTAQRAYLRVMRTDTTAYDPYREVAMRQKLLDHPPIQRRELDAYLVLINGLATQLRGVAGSRSTERARVVEFLKDAINRQHRLIRHLDAACGLSKHESFRLARSEFQRGVATWEQGLSTWISGGF